MSQAPAQVGWSKIREDMLRPPEEPVVFSFVTGVGSQVALTLFIGLFLACLFYTSQAIRPWLLTIGLGLFACCGFVNGFMTSRSLKFFRISDWQQSALISAVAFPLFLCITLSLAEIIESMAGASMAHPISEGVLFYLLWWGLDGPAAAYGAYKGFIAPLGVEPPHTIGLASTNATKAELPFYLKWYGITLIFGLPVFSTIFYEFGYVMESVWRSYMIYGMFVVLFLSMLMMAVTIAALSIVVTYQTLSH